MAINPDWLVNVAQLAITTKVVQNSVFNLLFLRFLAKNSSPDAGWFTGGIKG